LSVLSVAASRELLPDCSAPINHEYFERVSTF
jgi:hypothetical protein